MNTDKTTQTAQHSPLPWETGNGDKWVYVVGQQNPIAMLENAEDAKLIVASVNHADKLAEALRVVRTQIKETAVREMVQKAVDEALAAYEAAQ